MDTCHKQLNLEFQGITFLRGGKNGSAPKKILKEISGRFCSGRLTAIIGPSGAGKTSLLNVLSGFRTSGVRGNVLVNNKIRVLQTFRKQCCYITQEFAMMELMTTLETFKTTSDLKLGPSVSDKVKYRLVEDIGNILMLTDCMNTQVRHLSGGEKKRLSIGLELITNPPIMFFDEPTSGLDSSSSVQVISHLKQLAAGGRTVVCVVHQPSSRIFQMFDDIFILVDGKCLYSGTAEDMVHIMQDAGFKCPKYYNRADFAIEVACGERGDPSKLYETSINIRPKTPDCISSLANGSSGGDVLQPMLDARENHTVSINVFDKRYVNTEKKVHYPTSSSYQFWILLKRSIFCNTIRDVYIAQIRFIAQILVGLMMGVVFFNLGDEAAKVHTNSSYMFFSLMFIFFSNAMPTVQTFPKEASVFFREHLNNWYSMKAYYFSKIVSDLPLQILCPTVYVLITYFMTSQPLELFRICLLLFICLLVTIMAQSLGHVFGAAFGAELGTFLVPASAIPMFLFSGYFLLVSDVPYCLQWLSKVSYLRYPFEGMMISIYGYNRTNLHCSIPYCHYKYPLKFLHDTDIDPGNYWTDVFGIVSWILFLRIVFYIVLKWKLYRIRGF